MPSWTLPSANACMHKMKPSFGYVYVKSPLRGVYITMD